MKKKTILVASLAVLLLACHPTELLQDGTTSQYKNEKLKKVAVVAFPGQLMDVKVFENVVSQRLKSVDAEVIEGYKVFEGKENIPGDANSIRVALKELGYDGMLEIKLVSIRQEATNTESNYPTRREYRIMDVSHYGKLIQEYDKRVEKGATFEDTKVKMDIRLLDISQNDAKVIWSARTETSNPKTAKKVAVGMSSKTLPKLKKMPIFGE